MISSAKEKVTIIIKLIF